uniref:Tetraspanin n=1 Tax=Phallusia mammillata TaxID=59560 RepID=A0A6F9DWQ7_9ASCI|nr:tetraspanin-3 [Phallusia mammillata]
MGFCSASLKCLLFVMNFFFWAAAAFMMYAGIEFINSKDGGFAQVSARPAIILITSASVLILGGLIGCLGAICEKKTCLGLYLVFLVSVLIVQASISGILLVNRKSTKSSFDSFLKDQFHQYGNNTVPDSNSTDDVYFNATSFVDLIQSDVECCGYHNYTDWFDLPWGGKGNVVPTSCCNTTMNVNCTGATDKEHLKFIYTQGCKEPLNKAFKFAFDFMAYAALGLAIFIFIGTLIVIGFLCKNKDQAFGYSQMDPQYTDA